MHAGHKLKRSWRAFDGEWGELEGLTKKKKRKTPTTTYARTIRVHCFHFQMGVDPVIDVYRPPTCSSLTSPMVFALCLPAILRVSISNPRAKLGSIRVSISHQLSDYPNVEDHSTNIFSRLAPIRSSFQLGKIRMRAKVFASSV